MPEPEDRYPDLFQFLAGWFHQDWPLDHADADAALEAAIASTSASDLHLVAHQLADALGSLSSQAEADEFVRQMCDYYPRGDGRTALGWLELVRERVARGRS